MSCDNSLCVYCDNGNASRVVQARRKTACLGMRDTVSAAPQSRPQHDGGGGGDDGGGGGDDGGGGGDGGGDGGGGSDDGAKLGAKLRLRALVQGGTAGCMALAVGLAACSHGEVLNSLWEPHVQRATEDGSA